MFGCYGCVLISQLFPFRWGKSMKINQSRRDQCGVELRNLLVYRAAHLN